MQSQVCTQVPSVLLCSGGPLICPDLVKQRQSEFAMKISTYANVILLALKTYAIAALTLDSLLDLMVGGILCFTHPSMKS
ncbi:hypothetical protein BRADI_4g15281v3 [Brachypodium distachyon]|uniref:Uncharacterized protein n=1 Tax=Brachypodium distachyon TaxID=15368 RepID=A0A2K2CMY9_BRADI|nr:hypothetical protein BRADI_4g15281v3 [Brachypodium distachyon]PNT63407.1 hypothetical protein BRADI_4g15281v3 [Brachypodium distachyon]PNT63408.1 hypothetical protein BRADI_4g15281v3 [Brachypodium distachyon]